MALNVLLLIAGIALLVKGAELKEGETVRRRLPKPQRYRPS